MTILGSLKSQFKQSELAKVPGSTHVRGNFLQILFCYNTILAALPE